jgi:hypothetical protein
VSYTAFSFSNDTGSDQCASCRLALQRLAT